MTNEESLRLQNALAEAEAISTAAGLTQISQESLDSGGAIDLDINPDATASASSNDADQGSVATAKSFGLGLGTSTFFSDTGNNPYYAYTSDLNSPDLHTLLGANGSINGVSEARASTKSATHSSADAVAIQIGLADLNLASSDSSILQIGEDSDNPFEAIAVASNSSSYEQEDCGCEPEPLSHLNATAIVRGIENPLGSDGTKNILGQPVANVRATSHLANLTNSSALRGSSTADAKAIQGSDITTTANGNGNDYASIIGNATAVTGLKGLVPKELSPAPGGDPALTFSATAIGIDGGNKDNKGIIKGNPGLDNVIQGSAEVILDVDDDAYLVNSHIFHEPCVDTELKAIGIKDLDIKTGLGADLIIGQAGIDTGAAILKPNTSDVDVAGMRNVNVHTGIGDDVVMGLITSLPEADPFEKGTSELAFNGFQGHEPDNKNIVRVGLGNDQVGGSAVNYDFDAGMGSDVVNLDNAWNASLMGGIGDDSLVAGGVSKDPTSGEITYGTTEDVELLGGLGNDYLEGGSGDFKEFNGNDFFESGSGIDVSKGNGGRDTFSYAKGAGALQGTASSAVNDLLLDESAWAELTPEEQASVLGKTERVLDFQAGHFPESDVLQLSSSLSTITAEEWTQEGVIMTAAQASDPINSNRIGVVVDSLANIQAMGSTNRHYAISINADGQSGLLMYDADGDFAQGTQVVAALSGNLGGSGLGAGFSKQNISFA